MAGSSAFPPRSDPNIGLSLRRRMGTPPPTMEEPQRPTKDNCDSHQKEVGAGLLAEPAAEFHATSRRNRRFFPPPERAESPLDSVFCRQRKRCPRLFLLLPSFSPSGRKHPPPNQPTSQRQGIQRILKNVASFVAKFIN